jgi:hypothetical protein
MSFGTLAVDYIRYTNNASGLTTSLSGVFNGQFPGITTTGTLSGSYVVANSGAFSGTVTGATGSFSTTSGTSGVFSIVSGTSGIFTGTVSGTSGVFAASTLTDPAIVGTILEDVYVITDGAAFEVDPGNGSVQLITLGASRTPKATNFAAGESITLMVNDGTAYTLTWTDATWGTSGVIWTGGSAPTLATSGYTVLQFWKVSDQIYGALVGSVA